jgi:hypothetical protein
MDEREFKKIKELLKDKGIWELHIREQAKVLLTKLLKEIVDGNAKVDSKGMVYLLPVLKELIEFKLPDDEIKVSDIMSDEERIKEILRSNKDLARRLRDIIDEVLK